MHKPFLLAPMAELSHRALRELIEGFGGCDEYFTEMISAAALLDGGPFERWYIDGGPCPEKLVYQLVGSDMGQMAKAASQLDALECMGIDLNMGCCAPLIRRTGAGIAWMESIDRAGELAKKVRQAVKHRLSVKIRLGFAEDFDYLVRFCRRLEEEGVDLIILHPRTASEKLKRTARWGYIGDLRQELSIPVAGNGDISDAETLIARANGSQCDAVMVGRAAVRQPWIFAFGKLGMRNEELGIGSSSLQSSQVNKTLYPQTTPHFSFLDPPPIFETGLRFLELLSRYQPVEFHISRARRFFSYFCDNLKWGTYLKNQLNRENSLSGMERVWQEHFSESVP